MQSRLTPLICCFTTQGFSSKLAAMSTIKAILEADADGTLHLPLPPELRQGKVEVNATLIHLNGDAPSAKPRFGCLAGKIELTQDFDEPLEDFGEYMQ